MSKTFDFKKTFFDEEGNFKYNDYSECDEALSKIDPNWDYVFSWLDDEDEVDGRQTDVDDWDVWSVVPMEALGEENFEDIVLAGLQEYGKSVSNEMTDLEDLTKFLNKRVVDAYDDVPLERIEEYGYLKWKGRTGYSYYY